MRQDGTSKGKKRRIIRKECKILREEFEVGCWNIARKRMLEERGALFKEEGELHQIIPGLARGELSHQLGAGGCGRQSRRHGDGN